MGHIRSQACVRVGWASALAGLLVLTGCGSDPSDVEKIGECGGIHFPDSAKVIATKSAMAGGGDQTVEVVAELPRADLDSFKANSHLGEFQAGVPSNWKSQYWQGSGVADSLQADAGNEHYTEWDGKTGRQVVVHDLGGDKSMVFARGLC
ncbi:hypothetical protein ACLMAL_16475 [Nocardia sp. CWNU-33]|uniref:hypothetical protein n=1 Tax=Nocardia sp. CWNU-33 TaxID=3392117 RepID=UPI00398F389C